MIIQKAPQNIAVMSGVNSVSEFKIRNSAKAFSILSSGLYSNKIRAILRELGCNAVDSHVAAGVAHLPFDLHLPTVMAPYFSIRDYGVGLSADQVVNIYTTYFESTKTESNDYIGALGLGSKSPFSYTDNFTITAIQNGIKGVYTAFINDAGVPSVALLSTSETDEANGVEVQFAVEKNDDIRQFASEAVSVYTYFAVKPNLTGATVQYSDVVYDDAVTLPRARLRKNGHRARAIMGNIAYPIDIVNTDRNDPAWVNAGVVLSSPVDIYFDIGEVEFQASREALSYDKATVANIQARALEIHKVFYDQLAAKYDAIPNPWDRAHAMNECRSSNTLSVYTANYLREHQDELPMMIGGGAEAYYLNGIDIETDIAADYNIKPVKFRGSYYGVKQEHAPFNFSGLIEGDRPSCHIVVNHKNTAILERAKYHIRNTRGRTSALILLSPVDKTQPMRVDEYLAEVLHSPPPVFFMAVDDLKKKPARVRAPRTHNIVRAAWDDKKEESFWREPATEFDPAVTYHYVLLKGFEATHVNGRALDAKVTHKDLRAAKLSIEDFYGVRAGDIAWVGSQPNWVPLEVGVAAELRSIKPEDFFGEAVKKVDRRGCFAYIKANVDKEIAADSPIREVLDKISTANKLGNIYALCVEYAPEVNPDKMVDVARSLAEKIMDRYPMLRFISKEYEPAQFSAIADYIRLTDNSNKGP